MIIESKLIVLKKKQMKLLSFFVLLLPAAWMVSPPSHTGLCGVDVVKAYSQNILGQNVGYYINLKNNSSKTVDAVSWTANFYNNFEDLKGKKTGKWESGNFTSVAEPGETMTDLEGAWIDGATKVFIKVTRVHFTDGSSCGK